MLKVLEMTDLNIGVRQQSSIEYSINSKGVWSAKIKVYDNNETIIESSSKITTTVEQVLKEKNKEV